MRTGLAGRTILFVHPSDELYGADRCLLELVRGLPAEARAVVVLPRDVAYAGDLSRELIEAGAKVRRVDFAVLRRGEARPANWPKLGWRLAVGSWRLAQIARESSADIVYTNTLAAVSGPFAALLARRRHIWHVHEVIADERWVVRMAYRLWLALLPGRVIANSHATARALSSPRRMFRRKTLVVYPGIAFGERIDRSSERATGEPLRIGFVGRLAPRKGLAELLEAVALVRSRGIEVTLDIYGTAPPGQEWRDGQYRRRALGLGLGEVVRFAGFVADVRQQLASVDVLVVPSQRPEPFGLVVLEGLAAGCVVIVCRNGGGSDEIIEHGMTGLYCGRSVSSIAAAIERMSRDAPLRERLGTQGQIAVRERFGLERYRVAVMAVFRDMLG